MSTSQHKRQCDKGHAIADTSSCFDVPLWLVASATPWEILKVRPKERCGVSEAHCQTKKRLMRFCVLNSFSVYTRSFLHWCSCFDDREHSVTSSLNCSMRSYAGECPFLLSHSEAVSLALATVPTQYPLLQLHDLHAADTGREVWVFHENELIRDVHYHRPGAVIQLNVVMSSSNTAKKANLILAGIGKAGVVGNLKTKIIWKKGAREHRLHGFRHRFAFINSDIQSSKKSWKR